MELRQQIGQRYGEAIAVRAWAELDRYLQLIELATQKKDELTAELEKAAAVRKNERVRGVGLLSSELLDREIGDWSRFSNRRQVASYTGLCPGEDSSGDNRMSLSIDKHGNPRVRATLVELAWLLPRYQPDYKPLARWKAVFDPAGKAPSAQRKKAVVALARRLAVDLWRIRTGRGRLRGRESLMGRSKGSGVFDESTMGGTMPLCPDAFESLPAEWSTTCSTAPWAGGRSSTSTRIT
jgi:transposase